MVSSTLYHILYLHVVGFEIKGVPSTLNYERYSIKEFSHCMGMLEDLCSPFGKLEGYFDKDSK